MSDALEGSKPKLSMTSIVAGKDAAVSTELDGEVIILDTVKGVYFGLDAVGALIWSCIQKPTCLGEVRDAVLREYEVDAAVCEADVITLVQNLYAQGLAEVDTE